jgi:phosphate transport system protein
MSTHYEERMAADLTEIRRKLQTVSELVEHQVLIATQSLLRGDRELAAQVVLGDRQVNRRIKQIDHLCHAFIVRHAPSAGHLRYVSAVMRLSVALERIGDYAGSIGRQAARLSSPPPDSVARDLELIAHQSRHTLSQALNAFHSGDVALARVTYGLADQTDLTLDKVLTELLVVGEQRQLPLADVFGLLRITMLLKRVAEQSENVCEQAIFAATGELRPPRVYRVLFVGAHNDRSSQIAEAYARKAFPESGVYGSAGWSPAETLAPALIEFMDAKSVDMRRAAPTPLTQITDAAEHYNVIVLVTPNGRAHIGDVPYRTTVVEWPIEDDGGTTPEALERLYQDVVVRVRDLMTTLAGPDAR